MIAEAEQTTFHIFFGSQTGTAEQEAKLFELQCRERGFRTETSALDDYPLEKFPEIQLAIFFVSTTGSPSLSQAKATRQKTWSGSGASC